MDEIRKFCAAINHEYSRPDLAVVQAAEVWKLKDVYKFRPRFSTAKVKGAERLVLYEREPKGPEDTTVPYFPCKGLYLNRIVNDPWLVCWSNRQQLVYYTRPPPRPPPEGWRPPSVFQADWNQHPELVATFQQTLMTRVLWDWTKVNNVQELLRTGSADDSDSLSIDDLCQFVRDLSDPTAQPKLT